MKKNFLIVLLVLSTMLLLFSCASTRKAETEDAITYPEESLVGWGTETRGGLDGRIIKVTNLNADGEGSLRAALEAEGPRTVVFEVGGIIDLGRSEQINITNPYLTVAGQTAPSPGITVIKGGITFRTHDVVFQHIRFRMGDADQPQNAKKPYYEPEVSTGAKGEAGTDSEIYNIVVDHCSVSWGVDENLSVSGTRGDSINSPHDVTFSNNFISECLAWSVHSKKTMNHSMGTLVMDDVKRVAVIGNFYAHNSERNPWYKANSSGVVVNNLIYDPGAWAIRISWIPKEWANITTEKPSTPLLSIVGNYMKEGPSTTVVAMVGSNYPENDERAYLEDNINVKADGVTPGKITDDSIPITVEETKPIWIDAIEPLKAEDVPEYVLRNAGARPADRDSIDLRLIEEYYNGTGRIIDSQNEVGGYPTAEPTYRELDIPESVNIEEWLKSYTYEVMNH